LKDKPEQMLHISLPQTEIQDKFWLILLFATYLRTLSATEIIYVHQIIVWK